MTQKYFGVTAVLLVGLAIPMAELTAAPPQLASHRAVYSMNMGTTRSGSNTLDARGVMYLELAEACDGWTVSQRVKLTLYPTQGGEVDTDANYSSWESRDGSEFRYTVRNLRNGKVTEEYRGEARLDGPNRSGKAVYTAPLGMSFDLPKGSLFPSEHMIKLIAAAQAGERRLSRVMFDGASVEGPLEVNAIIGAPLAAPTVAAHELLNTPSWPVRMAFFTLQSQRAEPEQEASLQLFENGVANNFLLDYGDFSVTAVVQKIETIPGPKCDRLAFRGWIPSLNPV